MKKEIGPQYDLDDSFKAAARLHQSRYRATVLKVDYSAYGNRLTDVDGRALTNYYDGLGVRHAVRCRYPRYSRKRDSDLLRSEHIPFNMLAPLADRPGLTRTVVRDAFGVQLEGPFELRLEWAPRPKDQYLNDMTSFDTYLQGVGASGELVGIGIEVKYTERGYRIGESEARRV
ncbi:MAG: PGN_0703 family putative restriction endonuclease, partial [Spirochaetota bacterium]